jgi:UDP-N-acetylmuramate dehydrogenase
MHGAPAELGRAVEASASGRAPHRAPDRAVASAAAELDGLAQFDVPLGPRTTYRVGGAAAVFVEARHHEDLERVAAARRASGLPVLVVGRGSNLLVADSGFAGIAVSVSEMTSDIEIDDVAGDVTAGGGVLLPVLARRTVAAGLTGFEWGVGVPGSVGGAVRMNAGGHGSDMASSLVEVTVADLSGAPAADGTGMVRTISVADLGLRFRGSALSADTIVLQARLRLAPGDPAAGKRTIEEIVAWRRDHQPGGQNAGSVFVNPVPGEVSAAELIDALGARGRRLGTARVSEKHANFIQADEGGSADDVVALMRAVRADVAAATGFLLRSEIRLIGFGEDR